MARSIIAAGVVVGCIFAMVVYLGFREDAAERRGVEKQIAADIAKANQNIATRRETDAHFDQMDAAAVCRGFDLEWVFENGQSFCR